MGLIVSNPSQHNNLTSFIYLSFFSFMQDILQVFLVLLIRAAYFYIALKIMNIHTRTLFSMAGCGVCCELSLSSSISPESDLLWPHFQLSEFL